MFTSVTECIDRMGQQLQTHPSSKLSRTGHNWATQSNGIDVVNGVYPQDVAARMWINAGFLDPAYSEPDYNPMAREQDATSCFNLWITARTLFGLPYPS
jgi:hypothetical protein